jgi:ketosteroid isomerase-like protein
MNTAAMTPLEDQVQRRVDRQAAGWEARDAQALVSLFHPDMVWPWPSDATAHDPARWAFPFGRYNRQRWKAEWKQLFRTHDPMHHHRTMVWIMLSEQGDGAFPVVDVDTLWRHCPTGEPLHWKGRACKG